MEADFWHQCWQRSHIGFHQDDIHPLLKQHIELWLGGIQGAVFVPLCGKSADMLFIANHRPVIGAELSNIACDDFFAEANLPVKVTNQGQFNFYSSDPIAIFQGDFFQLKREDLNDCNLVYDRAALVALPEAMQIRYVRHLRALMPAGSKMLLLSLEYPPESMQGPPFATSEDVVRQLFNGCEIEKIDSYLLEDGQFGRRIFDVPELTESAYLITFD